MTAPTSSARVQLAPRFASASSRRHGLEPRPRPRARLVRAAGHPLQLLHELCVAGSTLQFLDNPNGEESVVLRELSAGNRPGVVERLRLQESNLTLLEVFRALAPRGCEPHPSLLRFHHVQACRFEREDDVVRRVHLEP